jgi:methyl-accepting chemotaxis protein
MLIANPIYDIVFKYLMSESKHAKLLISKIIGQEIITIELRPQEIVTKVKKGHTINTIAPETTEDILTYDETFTVYRLDFNATIQTEEGEKEIIIEIQKAKMSSDIERFRKYLAYIYANSTNPIISIYFLGHPLDYTQVPVIKVKNDVIDLVNNVTIDKEEKFISSLTHESFIIQIPFLKNVTIKNDLMTLLSIFDQENKNADKHILNIDATDFPEEYHDIIRFLQRAVVDEQMRNMMDFEDQVLDEIKEKEREIEDKQRKIEEQSKELEEQSKELKEQSKELKEQSKELKEQSKELEEQSKELEEQSKELEEKDKKIEEQSLLLLDQTKVLKEFEVQSKEIENSHLLIKKMILKSLSKGIPKEEIAADLGKTIAEINTILKN